MEGRLGKYDLLERLAIGGMAELFLARASAQHGFTKTVVLKRILPSFAEQSDFVQMFLNEARLAAGLHHPNIAQVFDFGEDNGEYFFTMEYVAGRNVRQLLAAARRQGTSLPLGCALHIVENVAAGLHHAHEHRDSDGTPLQIVHRDVSPSNVIVTYEGNVKLVDFGVAKIAALGPATLAGSLKGKVAYMSPEQCRAELVDRRSDIFSLGILLWELTTGRKLFAGADGLALLKQVERADVPRPSSVAPNYPRELEDIVLKALARDRDQRYATAHEFRVALEEFGYQQRVPLTSTRLASYMDSLFPNADRGAGAMLNVGPLVRAGAAPAETVVTAEANASKPAPASHHVEEPDESKTLVAAAPSDPEETSPGVGGARAKPGVPARRESRWLLWFGVGVIGLGMGGGLLWRSLHEAEPVQAATSPASSTAEPDPPKAPASASVAPTPPPLPDTLEALRALSYAERHAGLAASAGDVRVELHIGLDLIQSEYAQAPCRTFADALNTIEASDDVEQFRWALDEANVPSGDAPACNGLAERLSELRDADRDQPVEPAAKPRSKTDKRRARGTNRRRSSDPKPSVSEAPRAPEAPAEREPERGVATKLDDDLRGITN